MVIINAGCLYGNDLTHREECHIVIENELISEVGDGFVSDGEDYKDYLVIPALVNSHVHVGDSFAKEGVYGLSVRDAVGENGMKWKYYNGTIGEEIKKSMEDSIDFMIKTGTETFCDFREGGIEGVRLLKDYLHKKKIRVIILGRNLENSIICDGLGLNVYDLKNYNKEKNRGLLAIHAGEEVYGEVSEALKFNPDVIIHGVKMSDEEMNEVFKRGISICLSPRANAYFGIGVPKVREMLELGVNIVIGTDNVMVNSPNMWREMEFLSKISLLNNKPVDPKEILKMATVNAKKVWNLKSGIVDKENFADLIFLDKNAVNLVDNKDIYATLIHRVEPDNIKKMMIGGKFV